MKYCIRRNVLNSLKGVITVYKPPDVSTLYIIKTLRYKLCDEANLKDNRPPISYLEVNRNEDDDSISCNIRPSYADNKLARPRYTDDDILVASLTTGRRTSGVCVLGINAGIGHINRLKKMNLAKVLQVKAKLGEATQYLYKDEKVVGKATYKRVKKNTIDTLLSSFQAAHFRKTFLSMGINMRSQEAYELAVQGIMKPTVGVPYIYSVKCIEFNPPYFTLEMVCINDNENYILRFVHEFGLHLKTLAHCIGIRCIRNGPFTINDALINHLWTIDNVKKNIHECRSLLKTVEEKYASPQYLSRFSNNSNDEKKTGGTETSWPSPSENVMQK